MSDWPRPWVGITYCTYLGILVSCPPVIQVESPRRSRSPVVVYASGCVPSLVHFSRDQVPFLDNSVYLYISLIYLFNDFSMPNSDREFMVFFTLTRSFFWFFVCPFLHRFVFLFIHSPNSSINSRMQLWSIFFITCPFMIKFCFELGID